MTEPAAFPTTEVLVALRTVSLSAVTVESVINASDVATRVLTLREMLAATPCAPPPETERLPITDTLEASRSISRPAKRALPVSTRADDRLTMVSTDTAPPMEAHWEPLTEPAAPAITVASRLVSRISLAALRSESATTASIVSTIVLTITEPLIAAEPAKAPDTAIPPMTDAFFASMLMVPMEESRAMVSVSATWLN